MTHDQADELRLLVRAAARHAPVAGGEVRLIAVTGGQRAVGTTTIALNLAVALALEGRRAILVDADLERGAVAGMCGLAERGSILDVLSGAAHDSRSVDAWSGRRANPARRLGAARSRKLHRHVPRAADQPAQGAGCPFGHRRGRHGLRTRRLRSPILASGRSAAGRDYARSRCRNGLLRHDQSVVGRRRVARRANRGQPGDRRATGH